MKLGELTFGSHPRGRLIMPAFSRSLSAALFAFALGWSNCATAQEAAEMGIGTRSCAKFAQDYAENAGVEVEYFQWALGFMSALNWDATSSKRKGRDLNSKPIDANEGFLRDYCDSHPLLDYDLAVVSLYETLPHFK